ncbi:MAG: addiction module protein [Candidatus Binataceae bacterium]
MAAVSKKLEDEAMRLPARSRARLAERLLASLDETGPERSRRKAADPYAGELWIAEAERRAEELASGKVRGIPAGKAVSRARAALR